jgi:photosystem II stability/assembly factor-like uncharacterized protein
MKSDESFEEDVRASLRASAPRQVPEDLVVRIAAIPVEEPASGSVRGLHLFARSAVNLAAAAIVVVAVAALIISRNGANAPVGGLPNGSPSVGAPGATSSAATPVPAASPSPSPAAEPGAVPALGLIPASVTFVSANDGWVLGKATCASGQCAAIARTADGGRTWVAVQAPDAPIFPSPSDVSPGISELRFADAHNGWAFGPDLWSTHDGGTTWVRQTIPGVPAGPNVAALETAGGTVYAVVFDGGAYRVESSPVGSDAWALAALRVPVGAGPVPTIQVILQGGAGWLLENDRTVVAGARLVNGSWVTWQPPCATVVGPAFLAASGPKDLAAACDVGLWSNPTGEHLFLSHDGGLTFTESATAVPLTMGAMAAAASPSVIVVGGSDGTGAILVATFDAGKSWSVVARLGSVQIANLGFTTATQGVVVAAAANGPATLMMTRDGGHTWSPVGQAGS